MRSRTAAAALSLLLAAAPGAAPAAETLRWDHHGYAGIAPAARAARAVGGRLLLGLSGSPT